MYNDSDDKPKIYLDIISKKNEIELYLKKLEKSIYDCETKYLEGSQYTGNVIKGWDHIFTIKSKLTPIATLPVQKRTKFPPTERIFSQTSFNNTFNKEETNVNGHPNGQQNMRHSSFHSVHTNIAEPQKDNLIRKKLKKKLYSSLSLKKKKIVLGGNLHKNGGDVHKDY